MEEELVLPEELPELLDALPDELPSDDEEVASSVPPASPVGVDEEVPHAQSGNMGTASIHKHERERFKLVLLVPPLWSGRPTQ